MCRRLLEDLQLRGCSKRTQQLYARTVRLLSEHVHKSPDQVTEEEVRDYFLYVKNVKKWSRTASTIFLYAIKFFFEHTLGRTWIT